MTNDLAADIQCITALLKKVTLKQAYQDREFESSFTRFLVSADASTKSQVYKALRKTPTISARSGRSSPVPATTPVQKAIERIYRACSSNSILEEHQARLQQATSIAEPSECRYLIAHRRIEDCEVNGKTEESIRRLCLVRWHHELFKLKALSEGEEAPMFANLSGLHVNVVKQRRREGYTYRNMMGSENGLGLLLLMGHGSRDLWEKQLKKADLSTLMELVQDDRDLRNKAALLQPLACSLMLQICGDLPDARAELAGSFDELKRHFSSAGRPNDRPYSDQAHPFEVNEFGPCTTATMSTERTGRVQAYSNNDLAALTVPRVDTGMDLVLSDLDLNLMSWNDWSFIQKPPPFMQLPNYSLTS